MFFFAGQLIYSIYHHAFEKVSKDAMRGLCFFFGLMFISEVLLVLSIGVDYQYVRAPYIGPTLHLGMVDLPLRLLIPALASGVLFAGIELFIRRTFTGRAIAAVAQDPVALRLVAVDPVRIKRNAFGLSVAIAAIAGAMLVIIQPVEPSMGREYIGRVFAICVLGGLGSLPGTLIAALLIGVIESLTATFWGASWAPAVSFSLLLLTLAFRPNGLLGR
ncbi:branched-chain amino acid ABC transporter permease [Aquabacter sp. P-9]|uniref:branched-chain amino acid ABC transporter permease n=1 Tax=Aquabacter sediminis TaxID=3029197 RepID=UPI00237E5AEB|nr:branched-chain amino acid ABC transporter permease [Aquabacter sp. P-9]MDE1571142.1 branched-chain amino acid ABC transporter permease [Aquabacter sp. P-9]